METQAPAEPRAGLGLVTPGSRPAPSGCRPLSPPPIPGDPRAYGDLPRAGSGLPAPRTLAALGSALLGRALCFVLLLLLLHWPHERERASYPSPTRSVPRAGCLLVKGGSRRALAPGPADAVGDRAGARGTRRRGQSMCPEGGAGDGARAGRGVHRVGTAGGAGPRG
ncbi:hypothetical protein VULLAG_LOCUS13409 [Vulpes lagopus]